MINTNYIITCCSTADMSSDFFKQRNISLAYFHFNMDGQSYFDDFGNSMPLDIFYKKIASGATPTTSQVNVKEYMDLFEPILQDNKDILHITLSSGISGTYNSATIARDTLKEKYPDRKIIIIDSLCASSGYGLLVTLASDLQQEGKSIDEVADFIEKNKLNIHHWFFSTDLTSYFRGGRISRSSAFFGTVLKICPLLNMNNEGKLVPRLKCRGKKSAIEAIVKKMEEHAIDGLNYSGKCYISNSACYDDAKAVADLIESRFKNLDGPVVINDVGTTVGSHTGPGTVALFFIGDKRID